MDPPGVLTSTGTEIAYPLSSTRKRTGSFRLQAEERPSQNSPSEVWPSRVETRPSSSFWKPPRSASALIWLIRQPPPAAPTAWRHWPPVHEDLGIRSSRLDPQWDGICLPAEAGSSLAPTAWRNISYGVTPIWRHSARSR